MKSADVTSQAEFTGLTTVFLDGCLHMFFANFVPTFPIVHRPTFIFREWTHPLLLNAIALGSRFMFQKESSVKVCAESVIRPIALLINPNLQGEALWRLAHTAVATSVSWPILFDPSELNAATSGIPSSIIVAHLTLALACNSF
jgi:hypothetical protein